MIRKSRSKKLEKREYKSWLMLFKKARKNFSKSVIKFTTYRI